MTEALGPLGDAVALVADAVDPVAQADTVFERLDVDVRGPAHDRFLDDLVHQPDDRGVIFLVAALFVVAVDALAADVDIQRGPAVDRLVHGQLTHRLVDGGPGLAEHVVDVFLDLALGAQRQLDIRAQAEAEIVDQGQVVGVVDQDLDLVAFFAHGQDHVLLDEVWRDEGEVVLVQDIGLIEVDEFHAHLRRQGLGDVVLLHVAQFDEGLADAFARALGDLQGFFDLLVIDQPPAFENLAK